MLEAKNQLSKLVHAALAGVDVVIANKGIPVVRLVPIAAQVSSRKPGAWAALPKAKTNWDAPEINAAIAEALAGGERF